MDYLRYADTRYKGEVIVPSSVIHNGVEYSVVGADNNAFYHCGDITKLQLQEGMTRWGEHTWFYSPFRNVMTKVKEIYLPSSLVDLDEIPDYYFMNNTALVACHIPDVTVIGDSAFFKCSKLTTVNIPRTVKRLGAGAFSNCSTLTELILPSQITEIGVDCFLNVNKLTSLHVKAMTPPILQNEVTNAPNCTLYVPMGTKEAYEAAEYWKQFKTIIEE